MPYTDIIRAGPQQQAHCRYHTRAKPDLDGSEECTMGLPVEGGRASIAVLQAVPRPFTKTSTLVRIFIAHRLSTPWRIGLQLLLQNSSLSRLQQETFEDWLLSALLTLFLGSPPWRWQHCFDELTGRSKTLWPTSSQKFMSVSVVAGFRELGHESDLSTDTMESMTRRYGEAFVSSTKIEFVLTVPAVW